MSEAPSSPISSEGPIAVTSAYLKHRGVKGTVIFAMLTGSQAYNLATLKSDKDYLGMSFVFGPVSEINCCIFD